MERNQYLDVMKGIAIVLVVLGHSIQYGMGSEYLSGASYFGNIAFKAIYSFHMPLFMAISGYLFFYTAAKGSMKGILISRGSRLLLPVMSWVTIVFFALFAMRCALGNPGSLKSLPHNYFKALLDSLWFLWAVFWCSLLIAFVRYFLRDRIIFHILFMAILLFTPDAHNLQLYKFVYPYFAIGYYWNARNLGHQAANLSKPAKAIILALTAALYAVLLMYYNPHSYIYKTGVTLLGRPMLEQLSIDGYRWLIGLAGCVLALSLVWMIMSRRSDAKIWTYIAGLGKYSLGIYIVSGYLFQYVMTSLARNLAPNALIVALETIAMVAASCLATFCIQKSPLLNRWLLGGRT